ncbi:hypothetical protein Hsar01_00218 [Haloferula sargassicola]|uniref:3-keto-alpha-glucoside-1,2-lyase/3-keto-2-hydroxy-glucal hydratase domain-containing protein n=1 Tax=Haloferula sargassicola TaxID=490096 RepID=A0ABP9UH69_9BACT
MAAVVAAAARWIPHFGVGDRPDHPLLPGTPWVVHDGTRPQPPVVGNAGAVVVPPPADAEVLFDGRSLDAFREPEWRIERGILVAQGADLITKREFGALQLHLEWRIPAGRKVHEQRGGNSGVFLMGLYEIQILQSHDNPTYPDGMAGALYGQLPPLADATTEQGRWQSFDIVFSPPVYGAGGVERPARATVIHNGVLVQHDEAFLGPTVWRKLARYPPSHPQQGPLRFQFHGDPVEFRNVWVRELEGHDRGAR